MDNVKNDVVEEILSQTNIVDVISSYITLTKKGKDYVGVCPFHDDTNPSMHVSQEKQIYKCFACGAGGNVFNFIENYEHIPFQEALKILGDKLGINTNIKTIKRHNTKIEECYEIVTKFYENSLYTSKGTQALKYLENRHIDDNAIKDFRIGYAPNDDIVTKMLVDKGYDYNSLTGIGITTKTDYGYKDFFYNRIMFPITDVNNKVIAASGRIFNGEDTSKYINTKETQDFKKGSILYNYYQARASALKDKYIIITEGFFDVIRCHIAGFKNTVATMGTAFTVEHVKILRKVTTNIILLFDGDDAGAKATFACGNILMNSQIIPKVVRLPERLDPDEYILKYGKEEFRKLVEHPISFMEFKLEYLKKNKDISKISDLSSYVNDVIKELDKIDDQVTRDITIEKISKELGINSSIITSRLTSIKDKKDNKDQSLNIPKKKFDKYDRASYKLIYYMLKDENIIQKYKHEQVILPNNNYRNLANEILYFYKNCGTINTASLITQLNDKKELIDLLTDIESCDYDINYNEKELDDCITRLKEHAIEMERKRLEEKLKNELDISKKEEIFKKLVELKKREL